MLPASSTARSVCTRTNTLPPSLHVLLALCRLYNADPGEMLGWSETVEQQLAGEHDVERSDGRNRLRLMDRILQMDSRSPYRPTDPA